MTVMTPSDRRAAEERRDALLKEFNDLVKMYRQADAAGDDDSSGIYLEMALTPLYRFGIIDSALECNVMLS